VLKYRLHISIAALFLIIGIVVYHIFWKGKEISETESKIDAIEKAYQRQQDSFYFLQKDIEGKIDSLQQLRNITKYYHIYEEIKADTSVDYQFSMARRILAEHRKLDSSGVK
jgi:hypothetical protein